MVCVDEGLDVVVDAGCLHISHDDAMYEWMSVVADLNVVQVVEDDIDKVVEEM